MQIVIAVTIASAILILKKDSHYLIFWSSGLRQGKSQDILSYNPAKLDSNENNKMESKFERDPKNARKNIGVTQINSNAIELVIDHTTEELLEQLDNAVFGGDEFQIDAISLKLIKHFRSASNKKHEKIYNEIKEKLNDPNATLEYRSKLIRLLEYSTSPKSLEILLDYLKSLKLEKDNREWFDYVKDSIVSNAIFTASRDLYLDKLNYSSIVESELLDLIEQSKIKDLPEENLELIATTAKVLSILGVSSGIRQLLIIANDVEEIDAIRAIAIEAIADMEVTSYDAVETLRESLLSGDTPRDLQLAVIEGLVKIGTPEAGQALVDFFNRYDLVTEETIKKTEQAILEHGLHEETILFFLDKLISDAPLSSEALHFIQKSLSDLQNNEAWH